MERKNVYIGPVPFSEREGRRQREALQRSEDAVIDRISKHNLRVGEFGERYGEELGKYANAIVNRRDAHFYYLDPQNPVVREEEFLSTYCEVLANSVSAQPEEERGKWLFDYMMDMKTLKM